MTDLIRKATEGEIFNTIEYCLYNGISQDLTVRTNSYSLSLVIDLTNHTMTVISDHAVLFTIEYERNNFTWKEVTFSKVEGLKGFNHLTTITELYNKVKEDKGLNGIYRPL